MTTHYKFADVFTLKEQVEISKEKVQFEPIFETSGGGVVLLGFQKGQKLDKHLSTTSLMVNVIEGEVIFRINDTPHVLKTGQFILVGAEVPHSVDALADTKLMLVKVKPD